MNVTNLTLSSTSPSPNKERSSNFNAFSRPNNKTWSVEFCAALHSGKISRPNLVHWAGTHLLNDPQVKKNPLFITQPSKFSSCPGFSTIFGSGFCSVDRIAASLQVPGSQLRLVRFLVLKYRGCLKFAPELVLVLKAFKLKWVFALEA